MDEDAASPYRWVVLGAGTLAQGATAAVFLGLASVTPLLRDTFALPLPGVGVLLGLVSLGILATLLPWGALTDRVGERPVMVTSLLGAAATLGLLTLVTSATAAGALLLATGALGAGVNAASGRAVLTWFPRRGRGVAMGVRQSATPLGAAAGAAALPALGARADTDAVFTALALACLLAAVGVAATVHDPPGHRAGTTPRAGLRAVVADRPLRRLSVAAALLVVPQFTAGTLLVEYLHDDRGVATTTAAAVLAVAQVGSAVSRLVVGAWSDRVGSRLGPLRAVAVATAVAFGVLVAADLLTTGPRLLVLAPVLVAATVLATCWNGLAFTLAGEIAPPGQAAAAMSLENSANYLVAALTPAAVGALAGGVAWSVGFGAAGLAAVAAAVRLGLAREPAAGRAAAPAR
ncbi:MFS transporter [Rhodococcus aerolatus]